MPNWETLRDQLWERCGGRCEVSGLPLRREGFDAHHRVNRGAGGTRRPYVHTLPNLLALDPVIHNGGPLSVHGRRTWSQERGYLLSKLMPAHLDDPRIWPVWLHGTRWVLLDETGGYHNMPVPVSPPGGNQ